MGPDLPPHLLAKRKRGDEEDEQMESQAPHSSRTPTPPDSIKKRRIGGPAPPPAPLEQKPVQDPKQDGDSSSDDDDEYGPTLPSSNKHNATDSGNRQGVSAFDMLPAEQTKEEKATKRDEWMMLPPKQDDLSARMDPTKVRARGFNTGKSAKASKGSEDYTMWTETPEQKRKRLQDEVLGIKPTSSEETADDWKERAKRRKDEEKAKQIQGHNAQNRNQSLYDQHKRSSGKEEADDASKRGFDYNKDMSAAPKISHAQKREMLTKAADFGLRFSKGSYL